MHITPFRALTIAATVATVASIAALAGCATPMAAPMFSQAALPDAVKVPAGQRVAMETVGVGDITYQCREKAAMAGAFEWVFVGPNAVLNNRKGEQVGKYYGPPATWEHQDGSTLTGAQVAVSPAAAGSIPLQLVKVNAAMADVKTESKAGAMTGLSFIQRVATRGGVAPASACNAENKDRKEVVKYQADYIFWKAV
jgi:Protein of unknown function (DUF3455)